MTGLFWSPSIPGKPSQWLEAAKKAGKSDSTVRAWCLNHGIARRVVDGHCRVALQMLVDGNKEALRAYHKGDRASPLVARYFDRFGLTISTA